MSDHYLAIDLGASGGRHIAGCYEAGKLSLHEIYRFPNAMTQAEGRLVWDAERIFKEILTGMKKCKADGIVPRSVGIDTWGVDYALFDSAWERLGPVYGYRDRLTEGMADRLDDYVSREELYQKTGLQRLEINTIYQLMARSANAPEEAEKARHILMLPDYFHFLLSGEPLSEYTIASTSGLMNAHSKDWDIGLIKETGFEASAFGKLHMPGTRAGALRKEIAEEVGYEAAVVLPASHDTASAAMAVPNMDEGSMFLSSGTWSLLGCESETPYLSEKSRLLDFSNEGGYGGCVLYLKNIRGLWMIQSVRNELAKDMDYAEVCDLAEAAAIDTLIDPDDERFLAPDNMTEAIGQYVRERGGRKPEGIGEIAAVIYRSLAKYYGRTADELAEVTGRGFSAIRVAGGGSQAGFLNKLTAEATGLPAYAGPSEAAATGNILCQMIADGLFKDLKEARECVTDSFEIKMFGAR